MTWGRRVRAEPVWGTVVTMEVRGPSINLDRAEWALALASAELHRIDALLSPFRDDSSVTAIRTGLLHPDDAPTDVRQVIEGCAAATHITGGTFDPWAVAGGFDPCGFVKGWGADRAAAILTRSGFANVSVNAAGDVTCRGHSGPDGQSWRIGIADPRDPLQVITVVDVDDAHLATSGLYAQGDHIIDPRTGAAPRGCQSASVLAPNGGYADALATALLISGAAGLPWLSDLPGTSAYLVSGPRVWTAGPAFTQP